MTQRLMHLPYLRVDTLGADQIDDDEMDRIVKTYSYAEVKATWGGNNDGRRGLYFVIEGPEHVLNATKERLASGLYFATILMELK